MVFYWSLSDCKSPQVSSSLHSILAILNIAVVWMVYTRPPIFKSSSPLNNHLVTVPKAPITCSIFLSIPKQSRGTYPSFHFLSVLFCGQAGQQSRQFSEFSLFFFVVIRFSEFSLFFFVIRFSEFSLFFCYKVFRILSFFVVIRFSEFSLFFFCCYKVFFLLL